MADAQVPLCGVGPGGAHGTPAQHGVDRGRPSASPSAAAAAGAAFGRASLEVAAAAPAAAAAPPLPEHSVLLKCAVLAFFVASRALHPPAIDNTKVDGKYKYEAISVPLTECMVNLVLGQAVALALGGVRTWREIYRPRPIATFSAIGFVYAFGDFLELKSMSGLSGPTYQVLCQSKLIVTPSLLYLVKGTKQSLLQCLLLVLLVSSLCCYVVMKDLLDKHHALQLDPSWTEELSNATSFGICMVVLKIFISCLCAVLADKYMKEFSDEPIYVQLVQFKFAWFSSLFILSFADGEAWQRGMYHDWTPAVALATTSYTVTNWSTMILLSVMDSLTKNIGEAGTVLVTYFVVVWHPAFDDGYEGETFLTVLVVFLSASAYLMSKGVVAKAQLYDETRAD